MDFSKIELPKIPALAPTTVIGLAGLAGIAVGLISHQMPWATAIPAAVGAMVAIALPDNANAAAAARKLAADALVASAVGNVPVMVTDAAALEQAMAGAIHSDPTDSTKTPHAVEG
jgi:hypothetical protein